MTYYLSVFAKHDKIIDLLDYSKESFGDFNGHTLLACPASETLTYILTIKSDVHSLLKDAFRCIDLDAVHWMLSLQTEKNPPQLIGCTDLINPQLQGTTSEELSR